MRFHQLQPKSYRPAGHLLRAWKRMASREMVQEPSWFSKVFSIESVDRDDNRVELRLLVDLIVFCVDLRE